MLFLSRYWPAISAVTFFTLLTGCSDTSHDEYAQLISDLGGTMHMHVELGGTEITDSDLASLDFPDTVRSISLCNSAVSDRGVSELLRSSNLEQIDLTNTQITDAALNELRELPRLCVVNVASEGVSPEAFGKIRFFISDRLLAIDQRSPIQPLPRLPTKEQQPDAGDDSLPPAESLGGHDADIEYYDGELQIYLDFRDSEITDSDLAVIPLPKNIRSISLRGTSITDDGLRELLRARNLEMLDLSNTEVTDEGLSVLNQLPRLWKVNVGSTNVSAPAQRALTAALSQKRRAVTYDRSRTVVRSPPAP